MNHVLVLTAARSLGAASIEAALAALPNASAPARLAENAAEVDYVGPRETVEGVRVALAGAEVDANVVPAKGRAKSLLISDMDSTIIPVECIDEIADFAGVKNKVAPITEAAMRGELDFDGALRARVGLLKGLPEAALQQVFDERITLNPGAAELVAGMKAAGALTALISGGFDFFTSRVGEAAGFERRQANRLIAEGGALTGEVADPILGREAKLAALEALTAEIGVSPADAVAVGDGANDLAMIRASGLGVAYRAKPAVAAEADARLDFSDLTAILHLQGLPVPNR
ncbi:MAG: phosphoserine phosphatase SerB [Pseudomonadota bacterium]